MERYGRGTAYLLWIYLLTSLPMMAARMMARYGVEAESEPTPTMSACVSSGSVKKIGSAQVKTGSTWYTASTLHDSAVRAPELTYLLLTYLLLACWMSEPPDLPSGPPMTSIAAWWE